MTQYIIQKGVTELNEARLVMLWPNVEIYGPCTMGASRWLCSGGGHQALALKSHSLLIGYKTLAPTPPNIPSCEKPIPLLHSISSLE